MRMFLVYLLFFSLVGLIFFFRVDSGYRMPVDYNYDSDLGRDLLKMYEITQGKLTLLGPQLSLSGLHMGPYIFYIFAPFLHLTGADYRGVVYANAGFFLIASIIFFVFLKNRFGRLFALTATLYLATSGYVILSARSPGNAFLYLLLTILYYLIFFKIKNFSVKSAFIFGFLGGIIINTHPIAVLFIPLSYFFNIAAERKQTQKKIRLTLIYVIGIVVTFIPVILFDIRHGFVIFRHLFEPGNLLVFLQSGSQTASINTFVALNKNTTSFITLSVSGLIFINLILMFINRSVLEVKEKSILLTGLVTAIIIFFSQKGAIHYYFGLFFLMQFFLIYNLGILKHGSIMVAILLLLNIIFFPVRFYTQDRNLGAIEANFNKITLSDFLPKDQLNVILFNKTPLSKVGYEYRFFLKKYGFKVDDEFSYKFSPYLLVISETGPIDAEKESSWEFDQFGNKTLINRRTVNGFEYYLFKKN